MRLIAILAAAITAAPILAPAHADERSDAAAAMLSCASVRGDKARLKCFEAALPDMRNAFPDAAEIAAAKAEEARLAAKEEEKQEFGLSPAEAKANDPFEEKEFGAEDLPRIVKADSDDGEEVRSIESKVVEVSRTLNGKLLIILENGQVWRQIDGDSSTPYIPSKVDGLTATVKKAAFGSYSVRVSSARDAFKAKRIK